MGQAASLHDPRHVRIWENINSLSSANARLQMLNVVMESPEYVAAAKRAGIYAELLGWMGAQRRGEYFAWPMPYTSPPPSAPMHHTYPTVGTSAYLSPPPLRTAPLLPPPKPTLRITEERPRLPVGGAGGTALATIPPPKRALDVLHESYAILGIDDSKPLTHDALRVAYKRAAIIAHPDKGGSPEAFDEVSRAFLYLQEVLNKLIPRSSSDDARFKTEVTPEAALRARGDYVPGSVAPAPAGAPRLEDAPPIALNPKKLDLNLFNKLFEENRLPDPDKDDGYGSWLKSQEGRATSTEVMRGKYNKDLFNKMFEDEARKSTAADSSSALSKYTPPTDLMMAPTFGTELGSARPSQFTKATGSAVGGAGLAYTDLKFAYSDGATFSQEVANVDLEGRPKTIEQAKALYAAPPTALKTEELSAIHSIERARELAEQQRRQRLAARDVDSEALHNRMKSRLLIRE